MTLQVLYVIKQISYKILLTHLFEFPNNIDDDRDERTT
jgi:hypothetical protein